MADAYNVDVALAVLERMDAIAESMDPPARAVFEDLTAEPGELPRLMLQPTSTEAYTRRYVQGAPLEAFPFNAVLRVAAVSEGDRLAAFKWLADLGRAFEDGPLEVPGATVFMHRMATIPTCLGRTERFEDWQIQFSVIYKIKEA
jgi:hypothetical protein